MHKQTKSFKTIALFIMLLMAISPLGAAYATDPSILTDINNYWAKDTISQWVTKDLANGYPDNTFRPDNPITRAEFLALANKSMGFSQTETINFSDVTKDAWYYNQISMAIAAGYVGGYPDSTFRPEDNVTRAEAAAMIAKLANLPLEEKPATSQFSDANAFPKWSQTAIEAVVKAGLMSGYPDNTFQANTNITRAESIVILNKVYEKKTTTPIQKPETTTPATDTKDNPTAKQDTTTPEEKKDAASDKKTTPTDTDKKDTPTKDKTLTLDKTTLNMKIGDTKQLTATITPENTITSDLVWASKSDTLSATVSEKGLVTAIAPGKATITAASKDGKHTASCEVTVADFSSKSDAREFLLDLINKERIDRGAPKLELDATLNELAQMRVDDMIKYDFYDDDSDYYGTTYEMLREYDVSFTRQTNIRTRGNSIYQIYMNSIKNTDRKIKMQDANYTKIGIGFGDSKRYGILLVEIFTD